MLVAAVLGVVIEAVVVATVMVVDVRVSGCVCV